MLYPLLNSTDIPTFEANPTQPVKVPRVEYNPDYNPFRKKASPRSTDDWEQLYDVTHMQASATPDAPSLPPEADAPALFDEDAMEMGSDHFQFRGQYILTAVRSGLMIVEQHRAHVRILYERYLKQMQSSSATTQGLLFPEMIHLASSDAQLLDEITDVLSTLGFDITSLGGGSFSIQGIPSGLDGVDASSLLTQMVEDAREEHLGHSALGDLHHRLALTLARNAAIVVGQALSSQEMDTLLADLFQCENPNMTPNGKPVLAILSPQDIDQFF